MEIIFIRTSTPLKTHDLHAKKYVEELGSKTLNDVPTINE